MKVELPILEVPTGLTAVAISPGLVHLQWLSHNATGPSNVSTLLERRQIAPGESDWAQVAYVSDQDYVCPGYQGAVYEFRVRASCAWSPAPGGNLRSEPSEAVAVTMPMPSPSGQPVDLTLEQRVTVLESQVRSLLKKARSK